LVRRFNEAVGPPFRLTNGRRFRQAGRRLLPRSANWIAALTRLPVETDEMHGSFTRAAERLEARNSRFGDWPLALKSILGFWLFYALTVVARAFLGSDPGTILANKAMVIGIGILLTALIYIAIALFGTGRSVGRRALIAGVGSLIASAAMAATLIATEDLMRESKEEMRFQAREGFVVVQRGHAIRIERRAAEPLVMTLPRVSELDAQKRLRYAADTAVVWLFFFVAWSAFYLAWVAQAEVLGARRRAAEAEAAAQSAQVRALRYQVNPHFLFNTLNSLSSLVMSRRPEEAESMILKLSTFFRNSLSLDPTADVTLAEEIELQRLYLDIEQVRFPERLQVEIDVPKHLEDARVPGLILQPLVENAIKYGVSGAREPVTVGIAAREDKPGQLTIEVVNSASAKPTKRRNQAPAGTGVGLPNVCQRLEARFGSAAKCEFGPLPNGGYRVTMTMPLDRENG
jgi:two-component system LytT family sensor kinase